MSESNDSWGVQASYKFGLNGQNMLNVRGKDPYELQVQLVGVADGEVLTSITNVSSLLEAGTALVPVTAPASAWAPEPVAVAPASAPAYKQTQGPSCPHGARTHKTGVGAKGPWSAWFCPTPKGTPGQCEPQWDRA